MTKKQRAFLEILVAERAYVVRSDRRRTYLLVRRPRAGRVKELTLAIFTALRPHLVPRVVRPGDILPNGDGWNGGPATIWRVDGSSQPGLQTEGDHWRQRI
jgi:hypothetical protein